MKKLTTCLWFDHQAEEAAQFYTGIFPGAEITQIVRNTASSPAGKAGSVLTVSFTLQGQSFMGLNGGPAYRFNPAVSLVVHCATQEEVDYYWDKLGEDGTEVECGWVTDRFGFSWQIVPEVLSRLLGGEDRDRSDRVMKVMLQMKKLDIALLEQA